MAARPETILAEVLGVPEDRLPEEWDSLAHLRIVMRLEAELSRRLTPDEILGLRSLEDLEALLRG